MLASYIDTGFEPSVLTRSKHVLGKAFGSNHFQGHILSMAIWSRPLSPTEVQQVYSYGAARQRPSASPRILLNRLRVTAPLRFPSSPPFCADSLAWALTAPYVFGCLTRPPHPHRRSPAPPPHAARPIIADRRRLSARPGQDGLYALCSFGRVGVGALGRHKF